MPPVATLKRRHDLKKANAILKVMKRFKDFKPNTRMEYARIKNNKRTEDLSLDELKEGFRSITGEDPTIILELASSALNEDNLRKLLHVTIILANEIGQPAGNDLQEKEDSGDGDDDDEEARPTEHKKKRKDLAQRITNLEKSQDDKIKTLKEKVRSLALQSNPSEALILLSIDELARKSRKCNDPEADVFEELYRQAHRHQGTVNLASLTLSVIGGKASDIVVKAMSKCMKEKQVEEKISVTNNASTKPTEMVSPLTNVYPQQANPPPFFYPPNMGGWQQAGMFPFQNFNNQYRRSFGFRTNQWRPRGNCFFCGSPDHTIKDCEKMKMAKNK